MDYTQIINKPLYSTNITRVVRDFLQQRQRDRQDKLTKGERNALAALVSAQDKQWTYGGVNFSRVQLEALLRQRDSGGAIEFETLGPYLGSYVANGGTMTPATLINEDMIGLRLAALFHRIFPDSRLVALCDEYNAGILGTGTYEIANFPAATKQAFMESLLELLRAHEAVSAKAIAGQEYLFIAESSQALDAPHLVDALERQGKILRKDGEVFFYNESAELPLHRQFKLRAKNGRWLCEALDATTYLKAENLHITHIVVLPDYMKIQQDRVWEMLRVLGMQPTKYHNIFYDPEADADQIVRVVATAFSLAEGMSI